MVFDKSWFKERQKVLLFLCNNWILKYWFRWILRIHKDLKFSEKISKLMPNYYEVKLDISRTRAEFRTHNKFSKRLYYSLYPFWYLLHSIDIYIFNRLELNLNFGFDTLTVYPDPHVETSTVDGQCGILGVNQTFSNTVSFNSYNFATDSAASFNLGLLSSSSTSNQYENNLGGVMLFDTSSIPDDATISAAEFDFYVLSANNTLSWSSTLASAVVVSSNPASNTAVVSADCLTLGTTEFCRLAISAMTINQYNAFTLNSSGIANINKTGISKFGGKAGAVFDNTAGTWSASKSIQCGGYSADRTGTTEDPKLVVTYSTGAATNNIVGIL
jgi:hypothetical protein